jgi:hypothetical protein
MNAEIGTEAGQFPEKEYINGIFVTVWPAADKEVQDKEVEQFCQPRHPGRGQETI